VSKIKKKKNQPRYITIRIQYYPLPRIFFVIFITLFLSIFTFHQKSFFAFVISSAVLLSEKSFLVNKPTDEISHYTFVSFEMTGGNLSSPSGQVIFHGDRTKKQIALTFDADMTPQMKSLVEQGHVANYYDKRVIEVLNVTQTKATLFLSGMWIEMYKNDAKTLADNPLFELASHSYSHPSFHGECYGLGEIADSYDSEEIQKTQDLLKELTGITNTLFRFPGGCYSQTDVEIAEKNGLIVIQWDAAGRDGFNTDVTAIEENVLQNVQNGSIIVLHMHGGPNAPLTADALPRIINVLKEKGYQFVTVSELLQQDQTEQAFNLKQLIGYSQ
jgi:peptidoglycan-N-acetylglucosamine deacetylase